MEAEAIPDQHDSLLDQAFLSAAHIYKQALVDASGSPDVFRQLWRDTNLPYGMVATDPNSTTYRHEVHAVYRGLTGLDYNVHAELTSTKQNDAQFQIGYPWSSGDLAIIAAESAKTVQALRAIHRPGGAGSVIEFGAGWGNLVLPLAKSGFAVTAVDIDPGFTQRLSRLAAEQHVALKIFNGSFIEAAAAIPGPFETIIFQSSFHHCLDFETLLREITAQMLAEDGRILFLSEPITPDLRFSWGIRYDGEALWAVMCNGWLELGFREDFFIDLLFRHGLLATRVPGIEGFVAEGWCATRSEKGLPFGRLSLSSSHEAGFHPSHGNVDWGRFCRRHATLPGRGTTACALQLQNFGPKPLGIAFTAGSHHESLVLAGQERRAIIIPTGGDDIAIDAEVFVPEQLVSNGDQREIGIAILTAHWNKA